VKVERLARRRGSVLAKRSTFRPQSEVVGRSSTGTTPAEGPPAFRRDTGRMAEGGSRVRRRGRAWVPLAHGVHRPAQVADVFEAELQAWAEKLPASAVFTGLTAARIWGMWLPPLPAGMPVFAATRTDAARSRRAQVCLTRHPRLPEYVRLGDLRVATPPETLLACARHVGLLDLVVLADSALHARYCSLRQLTETASARRRGAPLLRQALRWCDELSESAWETLLRVLLTSAEVPVESQAVIRDATGAFVARGDLLIKGTRTLMEYDGSGHLEREQYARDRRRDSRLVAAGCVRHGYVARHLTREPEVVLQDADRALGRPHDPARLRPWRALLTASLFGQGKWSVWPGAAGRSWPNAPLR